MSATVVISETNNSGQVTQGISNLNLGAIDLVNLVPSPSNAIVAGTNSYAKYLTFTVTSMGGSSSLSEFRFWSSPGVTFGTLVSSTGGTYAPVTFSGPTQANIPRPAAVGASDPGYPMVGVAGDLAASIVAPGNSDLFAIQLQTSPGVYGAVATQTWTFSWNET